MVLNFFYYVKMEYCVTITIYLIKFLLLSPLQKQNQSSNTPSVSMHLISSLMCLLQFVVF